MFNTNTKFFINENIKSNYLKKIFSVSTDKAAYPSSILGVSKYLMEQKLAYIKTKNKIFISSARFANVSFSNGSILKNIIQKLIKKKNKVYLKILNDFFITHNEAASICLKALLKRNDGKIIIPSSNVLTKQLSIKDLCIKIINTLNKKELEILMKKKLLKKHYSHFRKKPWAKKTRSFLILKMRLSATISLIKKINYINLNYIFKYDKFLYDIQKFQNMNLLRNKIKKSFRGYINSNVSRVSKSY